MLNTTNDYCIHQLFEIQVSKTPDAIAVIFEDRQLTYRELNQKANQLAHYLKELGVKPETLVGICVDRSLEMIIALLGILKAGGAYVPLDPAYPENRLTSIAEDAGFPILLTQQHLLEILPQHKAKTVYINEEWETFLEQPKDNLETEIAPDNLSYVLYTSGSTGKPKGVAIEHRNTVALIEWAKEFFTSEQLKGVLASTSLCFDLSVFELFVTLCCGGKVILAQNALQLPKLIAASQVTLINTVPSAIATLLRLNGIPLSVNTINLAGEPLKNTLVQELYQLDHVKQVINLYGPTEDTTYSTVAVIPKGWKDIPLIGRPISNTETYLVEYPARRKEDSLKLVSDGVEGELYIGGAGLARGYLNRPELSAEKFIPNPFSKEPNARLYKTGDLAIYLPDGNLKYLGRIDHQVKIRGFRIELGEIESVLTENSQVREAVVVPLENKSEDKSLVAYIVPKINDSRSQISQYINQSLNEEVEQWVDIWNATYNQSFEDIDPTFDFTGWNDSFTGLPMTVEEVREWVDCTVERILSLRPQRVLEIGCGQGLLLFRIAPHCEYYSAIDLSSAAITKLQDKLNNSDLDWSNVTLASKAAHELEKFEAESFDTIIINSVIQYFPNVDYLIQVLEKATKLVNPGGQIFIGDVRSLPLLEAFHTGIQLFQANSDLSCSQLKQRIIQRITQDKELVIHPDFFNALKQHDSRISHVQTILKRGYTQNELIRFRSDVILHIDTKIEPFKQLGYLDWEQQKLSISDICEFLQTNEPETLRVTNIPDSRIFAEVTAAAMLGTQNEDLTVEQLQDEIARASRQAGLHPEQFWNLANDLPYQIYITWTESYIPGKYDVVFKKKSNLKEQSNILVLPESSLELKPLKAYANEPFLINKNTNLASQLRDFLKEKLPDYMIPSAFVMLDSLPLTPNGKVDRRALPEPKKERPVLKNSYVPPASKLEQELAEIWSQILEIEEIGINDNFFELGGHSLLAAQLLNKVQLVIDVSLPIFYLLKEPTITGLLNGMTVVRNSGSGFVIPQTTKIDWQAEATLDPTIQTEIGFTGLNLEPKSIFLTGATGFLGAFLLEELLRTTSAKVYCLVRASNFDRGLHKIQANLERYFLWDEELASRIIPVIGDLAQPLLGLTESSFQQLARQTDVIYHAGAFVNLVYPYTTLKAANVLGTQEILRLASIGKVSPVNYISTIDVLKPLANFGKNKVGEEEYLNSGDVLDCGYTQTKWVAEQLIIQARSRGIPTSIYRPGMLTGHSQTGASNTNDLMCRIIKGIIQLKYAPALDLNVNLIPINYASQAIAYLSKHETSLDRVFHIVNPQVISWKQLFQTISDLGDRIQFISHEEWQQKLLQLDCNADNALSPILALFTEKSENQMTYLETFLSTAKTFDYQNTFKGLKHTRITCPSIDLNLLKIYLIYFQQVNFIDSFEKNINLQVLEPKLIGELLNK
jgi:amino acid adenylation domain-containing protein/thioester reductase-like protein